MMDVWNLEVVFNFAQRFIMVQILSELEINLLYSYSRVMQGIELWSERKFLTLGCRSVRSAISPSLCNSRDFQYFLFYTYFIEKSSFLKSPFASQFLNFVAFYISEEFVLKTYLKICKIRSKGNFVELHRKMKITNLADR